MGKVIFIKLDDNREFDSGLKLRIELIERVLKS